MAATWRHHMAVAGLGVLALCAPQGARAQATVAAVAAGEPVSFDLYLPLRDTPALQTLLADLQNPASPTYHKWLTPAQFNARFGPEPAAMQAAQASLTVSGFTITAVVGRRIAVAGSSGQVAQAFATRLVKVAHADGHSRMVAQTSMSLPRDLQALGAYIPDFADEPEMQVASRMDESDTNAVAGQRSGSAGPFWFDDLKQAYGYPSYQAYDGTGVNVAVLIAGNALDSDIAQAFRHERFTEITGKPAPRLAARVDPSGAPAPADAAPIGEASLDVQQVLGGAPGASMTLVETPSLQNPAVLAGYSYIVQQANAAGGAKFAIVNSSFGACDLYYTQGYPGAGSRFPAELDQLFMQGNAEGITFVGSSGDEGGLRCPDKSYYSAHPRTPPRFVVSIELPSGDPHVTAVGGTNLLTRFTAPAGPATYASETSNGDPETPYDPGEKGVEVDGGYWGAGGGVSALYGKPAYQALVETGSSLARTTPDIGMHVGGCFSGDAKFVQPCGPDRSHVWVVLAGRYTRFIGTSIASPEFVGALALYVQKAGGVGQGDINPYLYTRAAAQNAGGPVVFHRVTQGFDGRYPNTYPSARYNYMVGNGTPIVSRLFDLGPTVAGDPQTPSNP